MKKTVLIGLCMILLLSVIVNSDTALRPCNDVGVIDCGEIDKAWEEIRVLLTGSPSPNKNLFFNPLARWQPTSKYRTVLSTPASPTIAANVVHCQQNKGVCVARSLCSNPIPLGDECMGETICCPSVHIVEMKDNKFVPDSLAIDRGHTVLWINKETNPNIHHPIIADNGEFSSVPFFSSVFSPPDEFSFIFNDPGTYSYHSDTSTMIGSVVVK